MYHEPLDPTLAADRLQDAWNETLDAFREALAALPAADRSHAEAYVGQVFNGTRMFHSGSVQDALDDILRTLRGEAE